MSEILNAQITDIGIEMKDYFLTFYIELEGCGWGTIIGGYNIGNTIDFTTDGAGLEAMMHIMDTVGVREWDDLKGKYCRVEEEKFEINRIGNIINNKWFDIKKFFKEKRNGE